MKQIGERLYKFVVGIFAAALAAVLVICIPDTQNNLPAGKMLFLPLLWSLAMTCLFLGGIRIRGVLEKYHRFLFPGFLIIYGICLFALCVTDRTEPRGDWGSVVQGAEYMAGLSDSMNWEYFAKCKNNMIPMLVIAQELKLGRLLGLSNPYWAGMFLNVIQVIATLICTFYVCRKAGRDSYAAGWLGMGMLAAALPVVGHSRALYTDSLSLCFGILGFAIWLKADEEERKSGVRLLELAGAGLVWGAGCALKPTVVICVIAVILYVLLFREVRNILENFIPVVLVAGILIAAGAWTDSLLDPELVESIGQPRFSYWIAIGLKGGGEWMSGEDYVNEMMSLYGMEAREDFTRQYIKENAYEFVNPSHIAAKIKTNFASGSLGSSDFMLSETSGGDFVWEWVSPHGMYFWRYNMICTSYFYFILLMLLLGCIGECRRKEPVDPCVFVPVITCLGMMLYLMIFEANNRQLYNEFMWFVCGAVNGLVLTGSLVRKKYGKRG